MILSFDPEKHQYSVDGKPVPSVTQLVSVLGADLDDADDLMETALDLAAERGITMHDYIAQRLQGCEREEYELPDLYAPYADAVDLFLSEHEIAPLLIETPLGCSSYAGTPDLIAEFDGVLTILDWKFVSQVSKTKVGAQLAGYLDLCAEEDIFPEALSAVQFLPDGTYRVYPVSDIETSRTDFCLCGAVNTAKNRPHPRGKI